MAPVEPGADRRFVVRLGLAVVAACVVALPVALLALVVKNTGGPVARLDLAIARGLHGFAVEQHWFVAALEFISDAGQPASFRIGATVAAFWLLAVDRPRLALWALVTTWGAALLGVVLKVVVERARPVLPDAVAHADGYSFPSGHALGAFVGCAVLLLLWLDLATPERRWVGWSGAGAITALVCFARIGLGVHYFSDVVGGCLVGLAWTAGTTIVFEIWRREAGLPKVEITHGIEPERVEPDPDDRPLPTIAGAFVEAGRQLPAVLLSWVLLVGATIGLGEVVTKVFDHDAVGRFDAAVSTWFAAHRTPTLNSVTAFGSLLGTTETITIVTAAGYLACRLAYRRWLEATALLFAVVGEVWGFLLITLVIDRPRPAVPHLDAAPPTSAFPSGHTAASLCCYGMLAILMARRANRPARWFVVIAVAIGVGVATSRLYRGMHHLTDVLTSGLYAAVWLSVITYFVLRRDERPARKVRTFRRRSPATAPR